MKFCLNCRKQRDYSHTYCHQCGQFIQVPEDNQPPGQEVAQEQLHTINSIQKPCPHCQRLVPTFAKYCPTCGLKLTSQISPFLIVLLCFFALVILGLFAWLVIRSIDFSSLGLRSTQESTIKEPHYSRRTATPMPVTVATVALDEVIEDTPVEFNEINEDMVFIPSGSFSMGASNSGMEWHLSSCNYYADCSIVDYEDMVPVHTVKLDSFYLDIHEVTNSEYRQCVNDGVCREPDRMAISKYLDSDYFSNLANNEYPVVAITWHDAMTFCNWDGGKTLPSEAQWEYAAKGPDGWYFPWTAYPSGNSASSVFGGSVPLANFCDANCQMNWKETGMSDGYKGPSPVMSFVPGAYGLYDMSGNVTEWIQDYYNKDYYLNSPLNNPINTMVSEWNVTRGGGWNNGVYYLTSVFRSAQDPDKATAFLGFRCAK